MRISKARRWASFMLACFALTLGVAVAAPLLQLQSFQTICSGGAMKRVAMPGDQDGPVAPPMLACPLCAPAAPPPGLGLQAPAPAHPLSYALQTEPAELRRGAIALASRARGPPIPA